MKIWVEVMNIWVGVDEDEGCGLSLEFFLKFFWVGVEYGSYKDLEKKKRITREKEGGLKFFVSFFH